jgi:hypothetical protein
MRPWFAVSEKGLKELLSGKKKTFVINELVQNCFDEPITKCIVDIKWNSGKVLLSVEDDSPEGFRNIEHAYTLFADTYKRSSPIHRGKYNIGEKLVLAICLNHGATISTTKGTVEFHPLKGRIHHWSIRREKGSIFTGTFRATKDEYNELIEHAKKILPPANIEYYVNQELIKSKVVFKSFKSKLITEIYDYDIGNWKTIKRETEVHLVESQGQSYVFEMGIPIMATDCKWHIDVQQRVPLTLDRESIRPSYLQDLYAEVLNNTYADVKEENASEIWVRTATKDERASKDAVKTIMEKRFGDKFLVRNPKDPIANDDAIAHGYNLISGSELSGEEWDQIKKHDVAQTTTERFGKTGLPTATFDAQTPEQRKIKDFAIKIAKEFLGIDIQVDFIKEWKISDGGYYGNRRLTFNLARLPKDFFDEVTGDNLDLIIHEIAHEKGMHTEIKYLRCITKLAGKLIMKALKDPSFFEI